MLMLSSLIAFLCALESPQMNRNGGKNLSSQSHTCTCLIDDESHTKHTSLWAQEMLRSDRSQHNFSSIQTLDCLAQVSYTARRWFVEWEKIFFYSSRDDRDDADWGTQTNATETRAGNKQIHFLTCITINRPLGRAINSLQVSSSPPFRKN